MQITSFSELPKQDSHNFKTSTIPNMREKKIKKKNKKRNETKNSDEHFSGISDISIHF